MQINLSQPKACPILGLAIYIFSKGYQSKGTSTLIFDTNAQNQLNKWIRNKCDKKIEDINVFDLIFEGKGTHSSCKEIVTIQANKPAGLSAINIWLYVRCSLGAVQSRYIFEAGGDHFVGRSTCG